MSVAFDDQGEIGDCLAPGAGVRLPRAVGQELLQDARLFVGERPVEVGEVEVSPVQRARARVGAANGLEPLAESSGAERAPSDDVDHLIRTRGLLEAGSNGEGSP
jgi:hypothetical protein